MPHLSSQKNVLLLIASGTIGIVSDESDDKLRRTYSLAEIEDFKRIILGSKNTHSIPVREGGLRRNTNIHVQFEDMRIRKSKEVTNVEDHDSAQVDPALWLRIAKRVELAIANSEGFDGFVVLHGLDTLSYSASGLSFLMGKNIDTPIIC